MNAVNGSGWTTSLRPECIRPDADPKICRQKLCRAVKLNDRSGNQLRLAAGLRQTVSPIDAHSVTAEMGSESEESESSGFGGQRLGQDVVNLKTSEKFLLVGVTVQTPY